MVRPQTRLTQRNANRLLQLAFYLKTVPEENFNFRFVVGRRDVLPGSKRQHFTTLAGKKVPIDCQTTACALGFMPNVFPRSCVLTVDTKRSDVDFMVDVALRNPPQFSGPWRTSYETAVKFFGITKKEADYLFGPGYESNAVGNLLPPDASAKEVAAQIESFVAASRALPLTWNRKR